MMIRYEEGKMVRLIVGYMLIAMFVLAEPSAYTLNFGGVARVLSYDDGRLVRVVTVIPDGTAS